MLVMPDVNRREVLAEARRVAVKAVVQTGLSRGDALTELPQCHAKRCWCGGGETALNNLVSMILLRAADEVDRAMVLELDPGEARVDHMREAWDEGYMHVMKVGTGRITRGENPYIRDEDVS